MPTARQTITWPENHTIVDVACPDEMAFWTKRFHVSAAVLKKVVQMVGPRFKDVAMFLHRLQQT
ncbi:MAG TPA: DUF3606 domain-containing protein [Pirellulales bacterium]